MHARYALHPVLALPVLLVLLSCSDVAGPVSPVDAVAPPTEPVALISLLRSDARLLICPARETAQATGTVGWSGGRIEAAGHELVIPQGAVLFPQQFEVEVRWSPHLVVSFRAVGHDSFLFLRPVTLTLNYSRCEDAAETASDLRVYHVHPLTMSILEDVGGLLDSAVNTVTARTIHLSDYAVGSPQ